MTHQIQLRRVCPDCHGITMVPSPAWAGWRLGLPEPQPPEEIVCPACTGTGYQNRWVTLDELYRHIEVTLRLSQMELPISGEPPVAQVIPAPVQNEYAQDTPSPAGKVAFPVATVTDGSNPITPDLTIQDAGNGIPETPLDLIEGEDYLPGPAGTVDALTGSGIAKWQASQSYCGFRVQERVRTINDEIGIIQGIDRSNPQTGPQLLVRLADGIGEVVPMHPFDLDHITERAIPMTVQVLDDDQLLQRWYELHRAEDYSREQRQAVEYIVQHRLEERGATELPHPTLICKLEAGTPTYDTGKLASLRELLPPEVINSGFTPAHDQVVHVPDKWHGTHLNSWAKRFGNDVRAIIETARIPGVLRLRIEEKK